MLVIAGGHDAWWTSARTPAGTASPYLNGGAVGACIAQCKNASAALFTSAKLAHLRLLPQGDPERGERAIRMVAQMDAEKFGSCSNEGECEAVCPKEIRMVNISLMNREYERAIIGGKK